MSVTPYSTITKKSCPVHQTPFILAIESQHQYTSIKDTSLYRHTSLGVFSQIILTPITEMNVTVACAACRLQASCVWYRKEQDEIGLQLTYLAGNLQVLCRRQAQRQQATALDQVLKELLAIPCEDSRIIAVQDTNQQFCSLARHAQCLTVTGYAQQMFFYRTTAATRAEQIAELMLVLPLEYLIDPSQGWLVSDSPMLSYCDLRIYSYQAL